MFDVQVITSGDLLYPKERMLVIMNHRTMLDWLFFFQVLMHHTTVKTEKVILKRGPSIVPGFGWAMQMGNYIFLARKWEKDKPWLEECFKYYKNLSYGGQFLLFPEGTDFCEASKKRSNQYADKNGLPHYEYVLHPRTTGFAFILKYLRDADLIDSVFNITVGYPDRIPHKFDPFSGNFPYKVEFNMQRYSLDELPSETKELEQWCVDQWAEKENHLKQFYVEKKSLAEVIGEAKKSRNVKEEEGEEVNGQSHLKNGKLEQNGNSITPAKDATYRQTVARSHLKNLVSILFFWGFFTVFTILALYFSVIVRYQCLIALAVFVLAHKMGGTDLYQLFAYNWLRRTKLSPMMNLSS
ncbi:lysocardiolipin acyltransferase 1-like [Apostichopus japonicus]